MLAFFRRQNGRAFFPPLPIAAFLRRSWRWADSNGGAWNVSALHSRFCKAKGQRHFKTMLAFGASRRPYRPTAVCTGQLAGNRTRPASRGTRRAMAVKPRPSCMSLYAPARLRRAVRMGLSPYPCKKGFMEERRSKIRSGLTSLFSTSCRVASPVSTRMLKMPKLRPVAMSVYRRSPTMASSSF